MEIYRDWDLQLTVDQVLRAQGADPATVRARRPRLVEIAAWALAEGVPLLAPVVAQATYRVRELRHETLRLAGGARLQGRLIGQHLGAAEAVTGIVATIGPGLEELVGQVLAEDPSLGFALDGVASAAVETLANLAVARIAAAAQQRDWEVSLALSPGMIGWPVAEGQAQLFALVDAAAVGVTRSDGGMMHPLKSVSQVVGLGERVGVLGRTCDYCAARDHCRYQDHYSRTV
jgi:hypothetical protein